MITRPGHQKKKKKPSSSTEHAKVKRKKKKRLIVVVRFQSVNISNTHRRIVTSIIGSII